MFIKGQYGSSLIGPAWLKFIKNIQVEKKAINRSLYRILKMIIKVKPNYVLIISEFARYVGQYNIKG